MTVAQGPPQAMAIPSPHGEIQCIHHPDSGEGAVIWVAGKLGGFDGPSGLYGPLSGEMAKDGIGSLRLHYREPGILQECIHDVLAGVAFLKEKGMRHIGLVGHSFGGAVVIGAAAQIPDVAAVVALSSQTHGARPVAQVAPRPILIVHGMADRHLPPTCSLTIYGWAQEPKELVLYPGAGHNLWQCRHEVRKLLKEWLMKQLGKVSHETRVTS